MRVLTIVFGILLTLLGVGYYSLTGLTHFSAFMLIFLGVLITLLGILQGKFEHKHLLHGSILLAFLAFLGSFRSLFSLFRVLMGDEVPEQSVIMIRSIVCILSALFIMLGLILIENFWQGWKAFGLLMGDLLARVVLTIFYLTIFIPFGLGLRLFGDPLQMKKIPADLWRLRSSGDQTLEDVKRQF